MPINDVKVFDFIAPIYSLFFYYQVRMFERILNKFDSEIFGKKSGLKILDIGCGATGALLYSISKKKHKLTGIDPSQKMLGQAEKKLKGTQAVLYNCNLLNSDPFKGKEFDIVFISFVLHGMKKGKRIEILKKAIKHARQKVIVIDYLNRGGILTDFIEWLEGGDYFNFVKNFQDEIKTLKTGLKILNIDKKSAVYILDIKLKTK